MTLNYNKSYRYDIKSTDLFLTEDLDARVRFLWGNRGATEGAGGVWGAGGEVRGRRPPAATTLASNTTIHHLDITISRYSARDARLTFRNVLSQQLLADSRRRTRTQRRSLLLCLWWRPTPMKVGFHWSPQHRAGSRRTSVLVCRQQFYISNTYLCSTRR